VIRHGLFLCADQKLSVAQQMIVARMKKASNGLRSALLVISLKQLRRSAEQVG